MLKLLCLGVEALFLIDPGCSRRVDTLTCARDLSGPATNFVRDSLLQSLEALLLTTQSEQGPLSLCLGLLI